MRWLAFSICVMISTYLFIASLYSGWASSTPVSNPDYYKNFALIYLISSVLFFVLGFFLFIWIGKRKKRKEQS